MAQGHEFLWLQKVLEGSAAPGPWWEVAAVNVARTWGAGVGGECPSCHCREAGDASFQVPNAVGAVRKEMIYNLCLPVQMWLLPGWEGNALGRQRPAF